jgi:hypothetical protein
MKNRELCSTCINDRGCTFPRRFPILQCEEFDGYEPKPTRVRKVKQEKMEFDEEPTV